MKHFINDVDLNDVLGYQYVIISNSLKSTGNAQNILKMNDLYPSARIISDYMMSNDGEEFFSAYYDELNDDISSIAFLIDFAVRNPIDVIILAGPSENSRVPYLSTIADFCFNEFRYPVYDYKKLRKKKESYIDVNIVKVKRATSKVLAKAYKESQDISRMGYNQRQDFLSKASRKKLTSILKKFGISKKEAKLMTKSEIREIINLKLSPRVPY